jgi:RNA polymerase sigma factor (sigma-70 family)
VDRADLPEAYFEEYRAQLRAVAYRLLGSLSEADDAVQETWLRLSRSDVSEVENLRGWLTTVVTRICLDMLRARSARREFPLDGYVPDPIVTPVEENPEQHALLADSIGLALLVVLDTLSPAERIAFVLHDIFAVPYDQVGSILDRSPAAAKQLASRARRRLRGSPSAGNAVDPARQRVVADAFDAASRAGDFDGLLAVLDPDVVLRADTGDGDGSLGPSRLIRGAANVAAQAQLYAGMARFAHRVLVNGAPGYLIAPDRKPFAVIAIATRDDKITEIDILADPARLSRMNLTALIP